MNHSIKSPLPLFSTELTSLSLDLGDYTQRHTSFYAKSLQYLNLRDICSSNFSWWIFHGANTPGRIEFIDLRTLSLSYREQTDGEKKLSKMFSKQNRPHGSHMLRFPRLESLTLKQPPVDCKVLFTDSISTHLDTLVIHGNCSSVIAASRLQFTRVNNMKILVSGDEALNDNLYTAADRYFEQTEIGSSCVADFKLSINIQRTASWVNITDLKLVDIEAGGLVRLVQNLYNLQKLEVYIVYISDECLSLIQSGLDEEERDEFELLDTRLEYLELYCSRPDNPHHILTLLNHLLLRTTTLKRIELSHEQYLLFIEKSLLPEKYPLTSFSI